MRREDKTLTDAEAIDTIWSLAKSIDFCMFVTWDGERQRARPLSARPDRDAGRIYFLIDVDGAKDEQIERFPKVTMAFADIRATTTSRSPARDRHQRPRQDRRALDLRRRGMVGRPRRSRHPPAQPSTPTTPSSGRGRTA